MTMFKLKSTVYPFFTIEFNTGGCFQDGVSLHRPNLGDDDPIEEKGLLEDVLSL